MSPRKIASFVMFGGAAWALRTTRDRAGNLVAVGFTAGKAVIGTAVSVGRDLADEVASRTRPHTSERTRDDSIDTPARRVSPARTTQELAVAPKRRVTHPAPPRVVPDPVGDRTGVLEPASIRAAGTRRQRTGSAVAGPASGRDQPADLDAVGVPTVGIGDGALVQAERELLTVPSEAGTGHRRRDQTAGRAAQRLAAAQVRARRNNG